MSMRDDYDIQYPHCDSFVLHRPGLCTFCDDCPELQEARQLLRINFTGEHDESKAKCPSEARRSFERIERWPGNRPYGKS